MLLLEIGNHSDKLEEGTSVLSGSLRNTLATRRGIGIRFNQTFIASMSVETNLGVVIAGICACCTLINVGAGRAIPNESSLAHTTTVCANRIRRAVTARIANSEKSTIFIGTTSYPNAWVLAVRVVIAFHVTTTSSLKLIAKAIIPQAVRLTDATIIFVVGAFKTVRENISTVWVVTNTRSCFFNSFGDFGKPTSAGFACQVATLIVSIACIQTVGENILWAITNADSFASATAIFRLRYTVGAVHAGIQAVGENIPVSITSTNSFRSERRRTTAESRLIFTITGVETGCSNIRRAHSVHNRENQDPCQGQRSKRGKRKLHDEKERNSKMYHKEETTITKVELDNRLSTPRRKKLVARLERVGASSYY